MNSNEEEIVETSEQQAQEAENEKQAQEAVNEEQPEVEEQKEPTSEEKLQKEFDETKDKYLRLMAEYDNYRKRTAKQMLENTATVRGDTIAQILPVYDNFERAANAESSDETYKAGVQMIFTQMGEAMKKLGVEIIDPTGEVFDPNVSNAVSQIEDPELGENIVAQTFQKGYKIGGKIIRYAMVVVANS